MPINNLNRTKTRRARFIVATADVSATRDHISNARHNLFIRLIVPAA